MSLSAVALYVLARELPDSHTKAMLSFAPVLFVGTLLQFATGDPQVHTAGLAAAALGLLGAVAVASDGLRRRLSFVPTSYDTSS